MRISPYAIPVALLLLFQLSLVESVSDENICETKCEFCCRNKQCQSKDTCKGNYKTFIILGAIVGGIILLFVLRYLYVQYKKKNASRQPKPSNRAKGSRWKTRVKRPSSSTDEKKSKSKTKKAKPVKKELMPKRSDEVFLNGGDNDSIITPDTTSKKDDDLERGAKSDRKSNSKNELKSDRKPVSKNEIKDSAKLKDEKKVDMTSSKMKESKMKESKAESVKPRSTSASKKPGDKMTSSKAGGSKPSGQKERGRSPAPGTGNKERSGSQKKSNSKGPSKGDEKKPKKNQV